MKLRLLQVALDGFPLTQTPLPSSIVALMSHATRLQIMRRTVELPAVYFLCALALMVSTPCLCAHYMPHSHAALMMMLVVRRLDASTYNQLSTFAL